MIIGCEHTTSGGSELVDGAQVLNIASTLVIRASAWYEDDIAGAKYATSEHCSILLIVDTQAFPIIEHPGLLKGGVLVRMQLGKPLLQDIHIVRAETRIFAHAAPEHRRLLPLACARPSLDGVAANCIL
mmetsp:Transcript_16711/g.43277  ORF Transcript_16711/g.43277 Transcript_16711/m.43277 type:complete len:129 (+) Transcript_16711:413-799(+)